MRSARLLAALALFPCSLRAQTITGRAPAAVSYEAGLGAAALKGSPASPSAFPSLQNLPFSAAPGGPAPKIQVKARAAAAVAPVMIEGPSLPIYRKEEGDESLPVLLEQVQAAESKPAGQVFSSGHAIMDRVLGVKSRVDAGSVLAAPSLSGPALTKNTGRAPKAAVGVEKAAPLGKFAEKAAMFGLGAFSLAGTVAAVHPLMAVVVYVTMVIPSLILHEMGHAKVAEVLGDSKIREAGRLSFAPEGLKTHFDLSNTLLLPVVTLFASHGAILMGAAKPLDIHYGHFANPIRDMAKVAIAGPAVHVALALAGAAAFGLAGALGIGGLAATALALFAYYNVTLALINLLPIFPADANHILRAALHSISPKWVSALDGFYVKLGRFNRLPLWLAIAALSLTGVFKAAALAIAGAFLGHAALAGAFLILSAAAVVVVLKRGLL